MARMPLSEFQERIYTLSYEELVKSPEEKTKELTSWIGFKWDNAYTKYYLKKGYVNTCSNVQVRSAIHSRSLNGWMNYQSMLKPSIELLSNYENVISP